MVLVCTAPSLLKRSVRRTGVARERVQIVEADRRQKVGTAAAHRSFFGGLRG